MNDRFNRFKFRVWNKKTKKMKKVMALISEKGVYYSLMVNENEAVVEPCEEPHMVLMQCTGLKDKNGVLIYEGDILAFNDNKKDIGVVKYGDFLPVDIINEYQSETPGIGFYYEPQNVQLEPFCWNVQLIPFLLEKSKAEIIGNIYESPELLEESKND